MKMEKCNNPDGISFHTPESEYDKIKIRRGILKSKSLPFILSIAMLALLQGCAPKYYIYKSPWQSIPVSINGNTDDWKMPLQYHDATTNLNYSVSNDGDNLYICIETDDEATVSGITKNGLQIWIDTIGKRNHQVGILCPLPQKTEYTNNQGQRRNGNQENSGQASNNNNMPDTAKENRLHRSFMERTRQMHVSGFKTIPDGQIELPDSLGIKLGIGWYSSNVLVYEAAVSLKSFLKYPLIPSDSSRVIGISFNFTSIPKGSNNGGGGGGFRPAMGMGFGSMGMMGVMVGGGAGGGYSPQPEAETVWRPFHLSTVPYKGN